MNLMNLARTAQEYRRGIWTPGEVVLRAFEYTQGAGAYVGLPSLRASMSPLAYLGLQEAAQALLDSMSPDSNEVGIGFVTPQVPAQFTVIPRAFILELSSKQPTA